MACLIRLAALRRGRSAHRLTSGALLALALAPAPGFAATGAASCEARSGATRVNVVELYTSEGCSSCPPADRWLSTLVSHTDGANPVMPLAFHVTYWDRLGWADRFARPAYTERQYSVASAIGATVVYTPQVIVNGADWRSWPRLPKADAAPDVEIRLSRDGDTFTAQVRRRDRATIRTTQPLSGYWAVLENGHQTTVRAGENAGATLRHDHVVSAYQPVGAWPAATDQQWQWRPDLAKTDAASKIERRVAFVVVDAKTQKPLQALALGC